MADKEKDKEKDLPTGQENQEPVKETDTPQPETGTKSNPTSQGPKEDPGADDNTIESLKGQISKLQKQLNEATKVDIKSELKKLLGDEEVESDVDPIEALNNKLTSLENQLKAERLENQKNSYIDSLEDVSAEVKQFLKEDIAAADDFEDKVKKRLESVKKIVEANTPKITRPSPYGASVGNQHDADYVKSHPELYNK